MLPFSSFKSCEAAMDIVTNTVFVELDGFLVDSASVNVTLISVSALSVTQSTDKPVVLQCQYLTYSIYVTNNGPSNATGVVLQDTLPLKSELIFVNTSTGTFTFFENKLKWNIGDLKKNSSCFANITIVPIDTGVISNYILVSSNEFNPNPHYFSIKNTLVKNAPSRGIEFF